jgi:hypothetical protein
VSEGRTRAATATAASERTDMGKSLLKRVL